MRTAKAIQQPDGTYIFKYENMENINEPPTPAKGKTMEAYLMKHMVENKASFTSNELHTVLNAMSEYASAKDAEILRLREALENLIALKQWKDRYGKDEHYTKLQPAAWESAKAALNP